MTPQQKIEHEVKIRSKVTVAQFLRACRDVIADRSKHTREALARDPNGTVVAPDHKDACRWCSVGVIDLHVPTLYKNYNRINPSAILKNDVLGRANALLNKHMGGQIVTFNDNRTHEEVVAAWDAAIADAEKEGV